MSRIRGISMGLLLSTAVLPATEVMAVCVSSISIETYSTNRNNQCDTPSFQEVCDLQMHRRLRIYNFHSKRANRIRWLR